ncbi:hypothetical protein ACTFIU_009861 [Dictyostelium citrinum]
MLKFKSKTPGGNETTVNVLGHEYLILNKESLEKLYKYILSENKNKNKNKNKNQKYEGWIKDFQIVIGTSNMYKVSYISGRIAPPRSFAKEPSRLLVYEEDFMTVIESIYNSLEESDKSLSRLQKTFADSPWGWFTCKKSCKVFFDSLSSKNNTKYNNNNYQSDEEDHQIRFPIVNNDFSSENNDDDDEDNEDDEDDEDNEDNEDDEDDEDDEKEVFFDTGRDSGLHKSSSSPFGARSINQRNTPIKVPPPPTTFKGKETPLKSPNPQKKRKWDDDTDYDPEVIEILSTPTTKIVTRKNINDEKETMSIPSIPPIIKTTTKKSSSSTTPPTTPTTPTTTTTTPIITASNLDLGKSLVIDDSLGYLKSISQFQHSILSFFKTTTDSLESLTKRLDKLEERGGGKRRSHRKHQNKKTQQSSDEDGLSDDNIESSQLKNEKHLEANEEPFINVKLSSTNISVCCYSDDHHITLDQLEKISFLPSQTVSFNSSKTLTEAFGENPLDSFVPISRKDDNGYVFVIASINKSYFIGVVNLNSSKFSEEIIKELNERQLAFDYKPSFDIEKIKTIEGKPINELQFFDYHF